MYTDEEDEKEKAPGQVAHLAHGDDLSDDEFSGPAVGNSEGESIAMTEQQIKQAKGESF